MQPIQCPRRWLVLLVAVAVVLACRPRPAAGQIGSAILGATGGLAAGLYTTSAIYVTEARFGRYIFSVDEVVSVNVRFLPMVVEPVLGAWLGARSGRALARAGLWGGVSFIGGAAVGAGAGHLIWRTSEGRWAGAIIGSALGFLTGATLGGRSGLRDAERRGDARPVTFSISFPIGRSR
jgi:hypothetical protein